MAQWPYRASYLDKQSPKGTKPWQKRWFVLENGELSYFKNKKDSKPAGSFPFVAVLSIDMVPGKDDRYFNVLVDGKVFNLRAPDRSEASQWVDAMRKTLAKAKPVGTSAAPDRAASTTEKWWKAENADDPRRPTVTAEGDRRSTSAARAAPAEVQEAAVLKEVPKVTSKRNPKKTEKKALLDAVDAVDTEEVTLEEDGADATTVTAKPAAKADAKAEVAKPKPARRKLSISERTTYYDKMVLKWQNEHEEDAGEKAKKAASRSADIPYLEGYLKKQSPKGMEGMKAWQKRWFVLNDMMLSYFKRPTDADALGSINIGQINGLSVTEKAGSQVIKLDLAGRMITLMAEDRGELKRWQLSLEQSRERAVTLGLSNQGATESRVAKDFDKSDLDELAVEVQMHFDDYFDGCNSSLDDALQAGDRYVDDLTNMMDDLLFCVDKRMDVIEWYVEQFNSHFCTMITPIVDSYEDLQSEEIGRLVAWIQGYEDQLRTWVSDWSPKVTNLQTWQLMTADYAPHMEGFLLKRSPKGNNMFKAWQKRYFILHNCNLYWYKDKNDEEPLGVLRLDSVISIGRETSCGLKLEASTRLIYLLAEVESEAAEWLQKLRASMKGSGAPVDDDDDDLAGLGRRENEQPAVVAKFDSTDHDDLAEEIHERCVATFTSGTQMLDELEDLLSAADNFLEELTTILDDMVFCNPPRQDIFDFYAKEYNDHVYDVMANFVNNSIDDWEPKNTLTLVKWIGGYVERTRQLGVTPEKCFTKMPEVDDCIARYVENVLETTSKLYRNMITHEKDAQPAENEDGRLYTMLPVDMFQIFNQQLSFARDCGHAKFFYAVATGLLRVFESFQKEYITFFNEVADDMELEWVCAQTNNGSTCLSHTYEFHENSDPLLEQLGEEVDVEAVTTGWSTISKHGVSAVVRVMFVDLEPLMASLFTRRWYDEAIIQTVVATIADFFGDISTYLEPIYYRRVCTECVEVLVSSYVRHLMDKRVKPEANFAEKLLADADTITKYFHTLVREKLVDARVAPLRDIYELLECDAEMFGAYYDTLWKSCGGDAPVQVADRILGLRENMDKKERRACLEAVISFLDQMASQQTDDAERPPSYFRDCDLSGPSAALQDVLSGNKGRSSTVSKARASTTASASSRQSGTEMSSTRQSEPLVQSKPSKPCCVVS